jgi:hypothetical protein
MSSGSSTNDKTQIYGMNIVDNGPKYGSYVSREADGSFPYDEKLKKEQPGKWDKMIDERISYLRVDIAYKTPKRWAVGRSKPIKKHT